MNATGDSLSETALSRPRLRGLRLLLVTPRYLPYSGGVETHVREVALRLAYAGVFVTVLTTDPTGALPRVERSDGIEIRRVRAWPASKDYYLAPGIYDAVAAGPWDVVHLQSFHTLVAPLTMLAALRARLPYIVTFHSGGHSSALRNAARGMQRRALGPLLRRADHLIAVAQFERELFAKQLGVPCERIALIPNGSDLPSSGPQLTETATGSPTVADQIIVSVGRLERYKGHHRVIAALPAVLQQRPDTRLIILGSGPYQRELLRLSQRLAVAHRVEIRFIPPADRAEMVSMLSQAALAVCMSEYETHPVAVIEALALHRPVLVADTSGLRELAERGWAARVPLHCPSEDVAAAIIGQLRQPPIPMSFTLPTWNECAEGLLDLYAATARRDGKCAF